MNLHDFFFFKLEQASHGTKTTRAQEAFRQCCQTQGLNFGWFFVEPGVEFSKSLWVLSDSMRRTSVWEFCNFGRKHKLLSSHERALKKCICKTKVEFQASLPLKYFLKRSGTSAAFLCMWECYSSTLSYAFTIIGVVFKNLFLLCNL